MARIQFANSNKLAMLFLIMSMWSNGTSSTVRQKTTYSDPGTRASCDHLYQSGIRHIFKEHSWNLLLCVSCDLPVPAEPDSVETPSGRRIHP